MKWSAVRDELRSASENKVIAFLRQRLAQVDGYRVFTGTSAHGAREHGVDIVASYDQPMGTTAKCYIQAKVGKITVSRWRNEIKGQIEVMRSDPLPELPISEENAPLRRILAYTGEITQDAQTEIISYRKSEHPRVELWDIDDLTELARKTTDLRQSRTHVHLLFNIPDGKMPQVDPMYDPQEFGRQAVEEAFSSDELNQKLKKAYDMSDIESHSDYLKNRDNILIQLGEWMFLHWLTHSVFLPDEFLYVNEGPEDKHLTFEDLPREMKTENDLLRKLHEREIKGMKKGVKQLPRIPKAFSLKTPAPGSLVLEGESAKLEIEVKVAGQSGRIQSISGGGWGRYGKYQGLPLRKHVEKRLMEGLMKPWSTADFIITLSKEPGLTVFNPEYHSSYEEWIDRLFESFEPTFDWNYHAEKASEGSEHDEIKNMIEILGYNIKDIREILDIGEFRTKDDLSLKMEEETTEGDSDIGREDEKTSD